MIERVRWPLLLVTALLACLGGGGCAARPGHAAASGGAPGTSVTQRRPTDGGAPKRSAPDAGGAEMPATTEDDCAGICAKLLRCKHGPWDTATDCVEACEGALEDDQASKTYRCAAKATSCAKLKRCGR